MLATNARTIDPSHTTMWRKGYEQNLVRRFKRLRRDIITSIVDNDAFGLKQPRLILHDAAQPRQFAFPRSEEKVQAFMDWLRREIDKGILDVGIRSGTRVASHAAWQDVYIRGAYIRGNEMTISQIEQAGIEPPAPALQSAFPIPLHADRLGLLFTRNFEQLRGITEVMSSQISTTLAEGMTTGLTPMEITKNLVDRVDKIGLTRARAMARTEIIRAHSEATLNTLEQVGIDAMVLEPEMEILTQAGVCPVCVAKAFTLGGKRRVFTLREARGVLPIHVNCRCAFVPVIPTAAQEAA